MYTYAKPIAKIKLRPNRRPKFNLSFQIEGCGSIMRKTSATAMSMFIPRIAPALLGHWYGTPQFVLKGRHWRLITRMEATEKRTMYAQRKYEPHRKKRSCVVNILVRSFRAEIFANI